MAAIERVYNELAAEWPRIRSLVSRISNGELDRLLARIEKLHADVQRAEEQSRGALSVARDVIKKVVELEKLQKMVKTYVEERLSGATRREALGDLIKSAPNLVPAQRVESPGFWTAILAALGISTPVAALLGFLLARWAAPRLEDVAEGVASKVAERIKKRGR